MSSNPLFSDPQYQPGPHLSVQVEDLRLVTTEESGEKTDWFQFQFNVRGGDFQAELERFKQAVPYPERRWQPEKKRWLVKTTFVVELCKLWPGFGRELEAIQYPVPDLEEEALGGDPWANE